MASSSTSILLPGSELMSSNQARQEKVKTLATATGNTSTTEKVAKLKARWFCPNVQAKAQSIYSRLPPAPYLTCRWIVEDGVFSKGSAMKKAFLGQEFWSRKGEQISNRCLKPKVNRRWSRRLRQSPRRWLKRAATIAVDTVTANQDRDLQEKGG